MASAPGGSWRAPLATMLVRGARPIHLINPLWDVNGGSDWRAIEMYKALRKQHVVRLWSRFEPARAFRRAYPIELIRPWLGRWPVGGTFVFVGAYYAALAAMGVAVRVMGGRCLSESSPRVPRDALLPAGAREPVAFLRDLDCFFYRTSDQWLEAYGRVVFEAMACGLPVVCGRRGGYADYIVHGVNGFLFDTSAQAIDILIRLRDDVALRERIGRAARHTVEELYRGRAWREKLAYFLPSERWLAAASAMPARALDPSPSELPF